MSEHTPAPWIIKGQDIIGNELNGFICQWSGRSANARLISAAPDLLEALEDILSVAEMHIMLMPDFVPLDGPIGKARSAIAKARGES